MSEPMNESAKIVEPIILTPRFQLRRGNLRTEHQSRPNDKGEGEILSFKLFWDDATDGTMKAIIDTKTNTAIDIGWLTDSKRLKELKRNVEYLNNLSMEYPQMFS
jgi:hypothetical protein